ncbi:MAG: hypothetical protein ACKOPS_23100, partial [Cyanobium sp.]
MNSTGSREGWGVEAAAVVVLVERASKASGPRSQPAMPSSNTPQAFLTHHPPQCLQVPGALKPAAGLGAKPATHKQEHRNGA